MILIDDVLIVVFTILIFPSTFYYFNYVHERTHQEIYKHRDIKSKIKVSLNNSWCEPLKGTKKQFKEMQRSHDFCEIIGYHLKPIIYSIMIYMSIIIIILWRYLR